jgi:hypothetical protein
MHNRHIFVPNIFKKTADLWKSLFQFQANRINQILYFLILSKNHQNRNNNKPRIYKN